MKEKKDSAHRDEAILTARFGERTELPEPEQKVLFAINKVNLYGIEFRLFDARCLYPDDDRISFVFLRTPYCSKSFMD